VFFLNVLVSELLAGLMYSMVAIGFVLIYKASGVFNFAQGTMVFLAALTFVVLNEHGLPFWAALPITVLVMIIGSVLIECLMLRPLVNRSPNTLFMATFELSFVFEGLARNLFSVRTYTSSTWASTIRRPTSSACRSARSTSSPPRSRSGWSPCSRSCSAKHAWAYRCAPWPMTRSRRSRSESTCRTSGKSFGACPGPSRSSQAGWGARQGVQFSPSLAVLKAMPVLIIGGFSSIPGAIVGGLLGATENLADIYIGPLVHGSVSNWFAYILAVTFLLIRPSGLFGEEQITRV
jgi:branched-chain amino acid transport system permease protein